MKHRSLSTLSPDVSDNYLSDTSLFSLSCESSRSCSPDRPMSSHPHSMPPQSSGSPLNIPPSFFRDHPMLPHPHPTSRRSALSHPRSSSVPHLYSFDHNPGGPQLSTPPSSSRNSSVPPRIPYSPSLEPESSSPFMCRRALSEDVAGIGDAYLGSDSGHGIDFLGPYNMVILLSSFSDEPAPTLRDNIELRSENRMLREIITQFLTKIPKLTAETGNFLLPNITPSATASTSASESTSTSASTTSSDFSSPSPVSSLLIRPLRLLPDRRAYPNITIWTAQEKIPRATSTSVAEHPNIVLRESESTSQGSTQEPVQQGLRPQQNIPGLAAQEETAVDEDLESMNIDLPEPNFPASTDEDQDDESEDEQDEELLEEETMGPEFQMSIDELAQLDCGETNADFHSILAQTQEGHQANITSVSDDEEDPIEITVENIKSEVEDIHIAEEFREQLKTARLEKSGLSEQDIFRLRNPEEGELDIDDPILRLSLDIFWPVVRNLSGVDSMVIDMCVNTCLAYTGPFAEMDKCPHCGECRYDPLKPGQKAPRQQFHTIIPGFYFQALRRTPENSLMMQYRQRVTEIAIQELHATGQLQEYSDLFHGVDILEAIAEGRIRQEDMILMFSVDGAQLYQSKLSDCWVYIWMVLDYAPDARYKKEHIIPGGVIPGPSKPKNLDSFLFPGLYHIAALQNEGGLWLWDALIKRKYQSHPFLALATADGPAMAMISGMVGHFGAYGCRLKCQQKGRRKENGNHYYPACLKPLDQDVPGSNHDDINIYDIQPESLKESSQRYESNLKYLCESTNRNYKLRRLETGICKPSIFSGLDSRYHLSIPAIFPADLMHLASFNITDLMVSLWCGTMPCDKNDDIKSWDFAVLKDPTLWSLHGQEVAAATPYLPGSFDRPPRNPAEKINSGYKAVEYLNWIYGLAPGQLMASFLSTIGNISASSFWHSFPSSAFHHL
ncbi:hypothetical protein A0H81_05359 [Grifola frondosa]|uniref:Uncharacterized protein n=1 Tax=Grifola frondosa TaxID=5627 RepID=A0A1C7MHR1_GRIFR|nr:hypothetical protein A0H81_05359 [Grifola frondosa]